MNEYEANREASPNEINANPTGRQEKHAAAFTRSEAFIVLPASVFIAWLYTVCFSGFEILPQISFTLFCPVAFFVLTGVLYALKCFRNKQALWWFLPVTLLSVFNGVFHANPFTWGNALLMHGLFAAYLLTALRAQPTDLFNLNGLLAIIRMVLGNWLAFMDILKCVLVKKHSEKPRHGRKILLGVLLALPVLLVIIVLLSSADAVFNQLTIRLFEKVFEAEWLNGPFILSLTLAWIYAIGYICLGISQSRSIKHVEFPAIKADTVICATFLILVNAVFLLFTFIQAAFLFNGGFMKLPGDMVYSQYAREGFFQLLFVTVINFSVILVFMTLLTGVNRNRPLKGLLVALCGFTGVLIMSSFYRMNLYTGAYGHTTLRLCVYTFLVMEVVLLAVTVWKLFNDRVPFIKWFALTGLAFYLIVNVSGSDYMAAKLNASLFMSGKLAFIDIEPVGPDGLRVLKPFFDDEAYSCIDYRIERNSLLPGDRRQKIQTYEDFKYNYTEYRQSKHWQNWSYLKEKR